MILWERVAGTGGAHPRRCGVRVPEPRAAISGNGSVWARRPWSTLVALDGFGASRSRFDVLLAWPVLRSFRLRAGLMVSRSVVEFVAGPQPNNAMQLPSGSGRRACGALLLGRSQLIASR
jgi:hypothetical protein